MLNNSLTATDGLKFTFGKDGDGNYGYYGADGSLIPFSSKKLIAFTYGTLSYGKSLSVTLNENTEYAVIVHPCTVYQSGDYPTYPTIDGTYEEVDNAFYK